MWCVAITKRVELYRRDQHDELALAIDRLDTSDADAPSWVNVEPHVEGSSVPQGSALYRVFGARGPLIPRAPGLPAAAGAREHELGIAHGLGDKAAEKLGRNGVPVPGNWNVHQDHKKRGLVIGVPSDASFERVVRFVFSAVTLLTPVDFDATFRATFHER